MFSNPIIRRFSFSQFRPSQVWTFGSLYISAVMLLLFINVSIYQFGQGYADPQGVFQGMFLQFAALEVFLLWLLGPANCSGVVAREVADKSFDFFRMLPLSAAHKTVGIVIGRNLFVLMVSAVNLLICLALAYAGGLSGHLILQMLAVLVTSTAALNLTSLMFSILNFRKVKTTSIPVLVAIGVFAFGPIFGFLGQAVQHEAIENKTVPFFAFEVPLLNVISLCLLFVAVWAYIGTVRRFTAEYESLFSRLGAVLFLSSFLFLLLGMFYEAFYQSAGQSTVNAVRAFWIIGLLPAWIVPLFTMQSFDQYLETGRRTGRGIIGRLLYQSNWATGLMLFVIWLVIGAAVCLSTHSAWTDFLSFAVVVLSFQVMILALTEVYTVLLPKNDNIGYLVGFGAALYCILPIIFHAISDNRAFAMLSPLQIIMFWESFPETLLLPNPLVLNAVLTGLLSIPIVKRYKDLIARRMDMRKAA